MTKQIEPTPEFDTECTQLIRSWRAGEETFNNTVKIFMRKLREQQTEKHIPNQARVHFSLGFIFCIYGDYDKSIMWTQNSIRLYEKHWTISRLPGSYLLMGENYRLQQQFNKALEMFDKTFDYAQQDNDDVNMMFARGNAGHIAVTKGNYEKGRDLLEETLDLLQKYEAENPDWAISAQEIHCEYGCALADAYLGLGDYETSWQHAKEMYMLAKNLNRSLEEGMTNRIIGQIMMALGDAPDDSPEFEYKPHHYFQTAIEKFNEIEASGEVADTLFAYGMSLAQHGDKDTAIQKLNEAAERYTRARMFDMAKKASNERFNLSRQTD